jgi:hypothetical protein
MYILQVERISNPEANFIRSHSDRENEAGINGSYFIYIRELNLLFSLGATAAGSFSEHIECRMSRYVREYESAREVSAREATEAVTL